MHPVGSEPVTLQAVARADKITLKYERFALQVEPDGITLRQTPAEPLKEVKVCQSPPPGLSLACDFTAPAFPPASLIRFEATAEGPGGAKGTETYFFAAGDYPLANAAIPIRLKTATTRGGLDLAFIGATDLSADQLRMALHKVVDMFFTYDEIRDHRAFYNFYYSRVQGKYLQGCQFTQPGNMAQLEATSDAIVFFHQADLRDCRVGKSISSEIDSQASLIHETGHALFDLQDEYCCDSSYQEQGCAANLWSSLTSCQAAASALGYPSSACTQLTSGRSSIPFWRLDPDGGAGCIMGLGLFKPGAVFRAACQRRIQWRHQKCLAGRCFTTPECP